MLPVHTILFPTDFSERGAQVFPFACSLARDLGARLVVQHVLPEPLGHDELVAIQRPDRYFEAARQKLREYRAPGGDVRLEYRLDEGTAVASILAAAAELKAGLIVMGTHGRTGLVRVLMGSVAERVLRRSPCPVLTMRTAPPVPEETAPAVEPVEAAAARAET